MPHLHQGHSHIDDSQENLLHVEVPDDSQS